MKVIIIYDNTTKEGFKADWGFSCLVEVKNRKILFDTGGNGSILLSNMKKLNIDPQAIDEVFISHSHFDHTGGLSAFLDENDKVKIYVPSSFRGVKRGEVIEVTDPVEIHEGIYSTGELSGIEQSLVIKTKKGLVIIVGCSHPGVEDILKAASKFGRPYALIGGLHGFNNFDLIKNLELVCPTHCTQRIEEINKLFPDKYIEGGVGTVIEI